MLTTIPGILPHIIQKGAPVILWDDSAPPEWLLKGTIVEVFEGNKTCMVAHRHGVQEVRTSRLVLDLTESLGMCIAARGLALLHGKDPGATAPDWVLGYDNVWLLKTGYEGTSFPLIDPKLSREESLACAYLSSNT
jgi:hypothetical protein